MPRVEDIAWKFVIREGKKWRCPYCQIESFGTVTRVKNHLLKIPKGGISICEKVPEPISTLMNILQNQVGNKDDMAWKFVNRLGDNKWGCHFCREDFFGDLTGVKCHLLKVPNEGISICTGVPDPVRKLMRSLLDEVAEEESRDANGQSSTEPQLGDMLTQAEVAEEESREVADEESREANSQFSVLQPPAVVLPSCYWQIGTGTTSACPHYEVSFPHGNMPLDNPGTTQQPDLSNHGLDAAHGNESASFLQQLLTDWPVSVSLEPSEQQAPLDQPPHLGTGNEQQKYRGLSSFPNDQVLGNSTFNWLQGFIGGDSPIYSPNSSYYYPYPTENLDESHDVILNTSEKVQMNEMHNPTVGSSSQNDSSLDLDSMNRLQDCSQSCVAEVVLVRSNISLTNTVQHPGQLPQRCDKEDGNDTCRFLSRTPMGIDPSIASQHTSDSQVTEATIVDSQVREAATNAIGPSSSQASVPPQHQSVPRQSINLRTAHVDPCIPSSSQAPNDAPPPPQIPPCGTGLVGQSSLPDLNENAPMMSHPNTGNNLEENKALKRKLGLLYSRVAGIRDELEFAASISVEKQRREVENWLPDVEKFINDYTEAASKGSLQPHQYNKLKRKAEDLLRQGKFSKGLFEAREAKFSKFSQVKMVGEAFQRNTTEILKHLEGNQVSRLGIYGMGGVGKTTIMKHIHNRLQEKENCNVLWITVSQDFNIQKLQDDIWEALDLGTLHVKDVSKRAAMLSNHLTERGKSTIIIDDVWEHFDLEEVGIPIRADGFKLVLTTRSFDVCCQMQCQEKIKIEPLSQKEAESLFMEELGSKGALNLETEAVVKSIVKECAGLPLGVITMAASMRGVTDVFKWKDCLVKLKESDMGQTVLEKKVLMKLKFSYDRLGNHEVQQCFLSCALYPEDKLIEKDELIEFFIDQGLFDGLNTREKQYNRGLTILNKLENVCLLEDRGSEVKMHDLIRDMALHIMSATSFVKAGKGLTSIPLEEYWTDALEKVSLMENDIGEFPLDMSPNCPKLSTFLLNNSLSCDVVIPDSFFKHLWELKVLNLSGCKLRELPDSISDLVNLRALLLSDCSELRRILYLGNLISLRKLDASGCVCLEALEGLGMLVNLRYLNLTETRTKRLPKGILEGLPNLQVLAVQAIDLEDVTKLWPLETLGCFFEDVDDFNKCVRVIKQINPHYYFLNVDHEESKFWLAVTDDSRFANCERSVNIREWSHAIMSVGEESTGICILIPQDVKKLTWRKCNGITNLSDMSPLENLEKLKIEEWRNLWVLCGGQDEKTINIHDSPAPTPTPRLFRSLQVLKIKKCPKLKYLFGHGSQFDLPHLQEIAINDCEEMVGITAAVSSPPPHLPPAFPSLKKIEVECCDKMKRMVESEWLLHFLNLREIRVRYCENMEEIIGGPPPYMPVEEISLESLRVQSCNNMRKLFTHELLIHLRNLQTIEVYCCIGMVEMISRAGQGQEGSTMTPVNNTPSSIQSSISLPKLKRLILFELPQLKSICEVPITCDSMEHLMVLKCTELNRVPLQLRLRDIKDLPYIKVEGEEKWKTLIWDHPNAQAILQPLLLLRGSAFVLEGGLSHLCELSI